MITRIVFHRVGYGAEHASHFGSFKVALPAEVAWERIRALLAPYTLAPGRHDKYSKNRGKAAKAREPQAVRRRKR